MKKILVVFICALIFYIICYDLKIGTLPLMNENLKSQTVEAMEVNNNAANQKMYYEVKIQPGDTVLSIIEKKNPAKKISITKIIQDFKKLNPKANPEKIQIGKIYKFPLY